MPNESVENVSPEAAESLAQLAASGESFTFDQIIFEARAMPPNLALYDQMGAVGDLVFDTFPECALTDIQHGRMAFALESKYDVKIEPLRIAIIAMYPADGVDGLVRVAESILPPLLEMLKINSFMRLGFRVVQFKKYESAEAANEAWMQTRVVNAVGYSPSHIEAKPKSEVVIAWENSEKGFAVRVKAEARGYNVTPPPNLVNNPSLDQMVLPDTEAGISFDVDSFVRGPIEIGQFDARTFILSHFNLIQTERDRFLPGT